MLKGSVRCQNRVVWLNNGGWNLRCWIDGELQLALFAVVDRKSFHKEWSEAGACATTEGVEDKEALKLIDKPQNVIPHKDREIITQQKQKSA